MGLFDRIKKAFTGKDEEEKEPEKVIEKDTEQEDTTEENSEDSSETSETKDNVSDEIKENTESTDTNNSEQDSEEQADTESEVSAKSEEAPDLSVEDEPVDQPVEKITDDSNVSNIESDEDTTGNTLAENVDEKPQVDTEEEIKEESEEKDVKEYDEGLKKSRNSFSTRFNHFLANFRSVDEDFFDDLEELLIESDVGYETALRISDELREEVKLENVKKRSDVSDVIVRKLVDMYDEEGKKEDNSLKFSDDKTPTVFLFVGVNGAGKTTTIGKLAHRYQQEGKKVLLAAGDTFRAGAIEQLQEWGRRVNVPVEASKPQTDPASVVFDAVKRAIDENFDILLVDTAGRLQNKEGLMRELEKIKRVITRELPNSPQEVLLVLDGSTGQNALSQAKQFNETTEVSGIVLTKIDGSSQGGIVLAIRNELHIPVKLVGLGEQMNDLRDFDPEKFIYGLFKELIVGSGK